MTRRSVCGPHRRSRPIGWQLERGQVFQLFEPVAQESVEYVALHALPLPNRKVGVLDRQFGQGSGLAGREGAVGREQIASQHGHGPAVVNDVVHANEDHVLSRGQLQHFHASYRALR